MTDYILYTGDTTTAAPAPIPTKPLLASYSQTDPQWADTEYSPGYTFRRYGCLICSYAMVASQLHFASAEPPTFAVKLKDVGAINGAWVDRPSRIPEAYPELRWHGAVHWRTEAADIGFLSKELAEHGATVIELAYNWKLPVVYKNTLGKTIWNTHFLVLLEITDDDAVVIDPMGGETISLIPSKYARSDWGASRVITGCRLLRVKVGG